MAVDPYGILTSPDGLDYSQDPAFVFGVMPGPTPAGNDTQLPPTQPVTDPTTGGAAQSTVSAAIAAGQAAASMPVWRQPAFQYLAVAMLGVVFIAHAAYVAAQV